MNRFVALVAPCLLLALAGSLRAQTDIVFADNQGAGDVILSGQSMRVSFDTGYAHNSSLTEVRLYRVPVAIRLAWARTRRYGLQSKDLASLQLERSLVSRGTRPGKAEYYSHTVDFGKVRSGEYAVVWFDGNEPRGHLFEVGSLGTLWHAASRTLLVYAVDLRNMRHRSDVQYWLVRRDGTRVALRVSGGLSWLRGMDLTNDLLYGSATDGSITIQSLYAGEAAGAPAYVQTDRPIYRPGQHIYLRAILRNGSIGAYAIPKGDVRVRVQGPDGLTIYDHRRLLTPYGTVSADIQLPGNAQLGDYQVTAGSATASVSVQAYKKPEYIVAAVPLKQHVVSGDSATFSIDAKYFFGRPAAGMHVHYAADLEPYDLPWYNPYADLMEAGNREGPEAGRIGQGDGETDSSGHVNIAIRTKHFAGSGTVTLHVDARDASGRTVSTEASTTLVQASYEIAAQPDRWYAQAGDAVGISVETKDYEGNARPHVSLAVAISGNRWDYDTHKEERLPARSDVITTDDAGKATYVWHPERAGSYTIEISGKDERGYRVSSQVFMWVSSPHEAWWVPDERITLIADKEKYHPGEAARILLTTPQSDADALLITSTDKIESARAVHVSSKPQTIVVAPPKDASVWKVVVEVPGPQGVQSGETTITSQAPRALSVTLHPDRAKYKPGERATFDVRVHDVRGRPVRAELGIGIADESIYAVQEDTSEAALAQFYDDRLRSYQSGTSWWTVRNLFLRRGARADVYSVTPAMAAKISTLGGGGNLNIPYSAIYNPPHTASENGVPAGGAAAEKPRIYFPDTAFWKPDVLTDSAGHATLSFTWPDSLTTWRATGVAVDAQTSLGAGKGDALVTKDFLVRLEMPRFLRRGDIATFTGIVNGQAMIRTATMHLKAGDLLRGGSADANTVLNAAASGSAQWIVNPLTSLGVRQIELSAQSGSLFDALRLSIPVEAAGAAEHLRDAGEVHDRNAVRLTLPQLYDPGSLQISLAPSIVASLVQNVQLLEVYPYDCTEQTMSAALPAVFVDRILKRTGLNAPQDSPSTETVVKRAISRLSELQHSDGSWGWWEADEGHPFMTAYALYGLAEFTKAGYSVPRSMIDRGLESLTAQLQANNADTLRFWGGRQNGSEWNTRAFMLYALSDVAPKRVDASMMRQTLSKADSLNDYALAVLGLAFHQVGNDGAARNILHQLNAREVDDGAYTYWLGQTWHYAWEDDPIETTAYALRLNTALDPASARVARIVNFLRTQQRGDQWFTTKDSAAAIYAISETVAYSSAEFHPDEDVQVFVGEKIVGHLHVRTAVLDAKDASVVVPADDLQSGSDVRFVVTGSGSLYWSTDWTRYAPPYARKVADVQQSILSRLRAQPSSFTIERVYRAPHTPWQVGDEITVETTVRADSDTDYVAIEDPFPAGVEYQPMQGQGADSWSGLQFFDDRAVFFADRLSAHYPFRLEYKLRVTTPGSYTAAPPSAYAMYGPPVSTVGQPDKVTIAP